MFDEKLLVAVGCSTQQLNARDGNVQVIGKQFRNGFVGLVVSGWRGRAHLQEAIAYTGNAIVFRAWCDAYGKNDVITVCPGAGFEFGRQIGNGFSPATTMVRAIIRMIANIGEISRPPIGGMMRRNGARMRSVIVCISAIPGL